MQVGDAPDRFLVGLATLSLLAAAVGDEPLLCMVDDAQWLDRVSAQTLEFVARRLLAEPVLLVLAVRESGSREVLADLPELAVRGLGERESRELLDSVVTGPLDQRVRDRIVAETRGNPLALVELPRGLTLLEMAGGFGVPESRPLSGRIEAGFLRRIRSSPRRRSSCSSSPPPNRSVTCPCCGAPPNASASTWTAPRPKPRRRV